MELKKGQVVEIYQDPITKFRYEGKAKLVKEYLPDEGDGLSMWEVRFIDEPRVKFLRTIYVKEG